MAETFDVVFQGTSKSECIEFIRAVRKHAKKHQKIEDDKWIADELYDAFDGEALPWYLRLPVNVRRDWELLQQALLSRWIPEMDDQAASVSFLAIPPVAAAATPAACPPNSAPSGTSTQKDKVGRVRIRVNGDLKVRYISKDVVKGGHPGGGSRDRWGAFGATTDAALALKVRLVGVGPNAHRLELVEHESTLSVLAAFNYLTDVWNDRDCWGIFVGVDAPGQGSLKDRRTTYEGPDYVKSRQFWTDRWQLENTGRLKLRGPYDSTKDAQFHLGIREVGNKNMLWFIGPSSSSRTKAELEFEPLAS